MSLIENDNIVELLIKSTDKNIRNSIKNVLSTNINLFF